MLDFISIISGSILAMLNLLVIVRCRQINSYFFPSKPFGEYGILPMVVSLFAVLWFVSFLIFFAQCSSIWQPWGFQFLAMGSESSNSASCTYAFACYLCTTLNVAFAPPIALSAWQKTRPLLSVLSNLGWIVVGMAFVFDAYRSAQLVSHLSVD